MEEATQKITAMKRKSMRLSQEARELMKDAKQEQKKVRTRALCIMGNKTLSILGIRDIEQHQKIFEAICADKTKAEELLFASLRELLRQERERKAQNQTQTQEQ